MKDILTGFICFICGAIVAVYFCTPFERTTDLEIYTVQDIIYIRGTTVTFESSDEVIRFNTPEQLREYISNLTAEQSKN